MKKLGKSNIEILEIAYRIVDRCKDKIVDCEIDKDTISITLKDRKIIMSNLYKDYYREEVITFRYGNTFVRENILNYCPSVNTIFEINNGEVRYEKQQCRG